MSTLASFLIENPLLARLALASLELAVLSLCLAALLRGLRPRSPRFVSFLWLIVLAKPVLSLCAGAPIALVRLQAPPAASAIVSATPERSPRELLAPESADVAPAVSSVASGAAEPHSTPELRWRSPVAMTELLPALWLAGVTFFLARYLLARARLRRIAAGSAPAPSFLHERHESIAHELALARIPELRLTEELDSPALVGIARPVVLLPRWLVEGEPALHSMNLTPALEWSLRHELAHCKWRDPLAILVRDVARILFHFHPAAWWAGRRHLDAIERACDQDSLRDPSEASAYARELYEILLRIREQRAQTSGALAIATRGRMARRIEALLEGRAVRPMTPAAAAVAALAGALVLAFGCAVTRKEPPPQETLPSHVALMTGVHAGQVDGTQESEPVAPLQSGASVFLFGRLSRNEPWQQVWEASRNSPLGLHNVWGRPHGAAVYHDLFENPSNPFDRRSGDLLVLLLTLDPEGQVPREYEDILPSPWSDIRARLEHGESFEENGSARDMRILVLAAPTQSALELELQESAGLQRLFGTALPGPHEQASLGTTQPHEHTHGSGGHTHVAAPDQRVVHAQGEGSSASSIGLPNGSRYVVTFDAAEPRIASVRLELAAATGSVALAMAPGARHVGGYAHYVRSITIKDSRGGTIKREGGDDDGYRIDLDPDRPVTVEYQVALEHDDSPWPEGGPDEAPYATADDVFWTGRALFLQADHGEVEVEFHLPSGWHVSTPWDEVPGKPDTFRVADEHDLAEAFLLAGSHAQRRVRSGDAEVLLAVGRGIDDEGEELSSIVQQILDASRELFGGAPPGRKLLVANRDPGGSTRGLNGGVFGNSISLLADRSFSRQDRNCWAPFVAHEIVHLWNGGAGLRPSGSEYWFSEGFTEYYAHVLCTRAGFEDRASFLERVRSACKAYLAHAGPVSLHAADARELQYDGGMLAALTLDLRLRARKPSSRGLDDLMCALFARHGAGEPYSVEDVAAVAAELAGDDLERFFERHVIGSEPLPLEQDLAAAGLRLASTIAAELPDRAYAIHEVLRIQSLTQTDAGLVVRKSASAGYRDDDRLVAIDGQAVRTFGDVQAFVAGSKPGKSVSLKLLRDSSEVLLPLVLGGREDPPLERSVDVGLEESGDSRLLDRILGH